MTQSKTVHHLTAEESVSTAVIEGVAQLKGVDPVDLDVCLHNYVDPSALDSLFDSGDNRLPLRDGRVSFTMADCRIEIEGTRTVAVTLLSGTPVTETQAEV